MIREGFDIEIKCAHRSAQEGRTDAMARHLTAAHSLALWADMSLLADYGRHDAECWQEYEQWKTTTAGWCGSRNKGGKKSSTN